VVKIRFTFCTIRLLLFALVAFAPARSYAHDPELHSSVILGSIGFDQRPGASIPLALSFWNEHDQRVVLADFFGKHPVILLMGYFSCPNLCPLTRYGLAEGLAKVSFDAGAEFVVVAVSIDPQETAAAAAKTKAEELATYGRAQTAGGWHFLRGDHAAIDRLTEAVGFRYAYDSRQGQFAHASGIVVLTPGGEVARYLFGLEFAPRDLRLALVEAANNRIGTALDQVLLFCYHYDPLKGQYTPLIMNVMRVAGTATAVLLAGLVVVLRRKEREIGRASEIQGD
jgi:protein SCO1/2